MWKNIKKLWELGVETEFLYMTPKAQSIKKF